MKKKIKVTIQPEDFNGKDYIVLRIDGNFSKGFPRNASIDALFNELYLIQELGNFEVTYK